MPDFIYNIRLSVCSSTEIGSGSGSMFSRHSIPLPVASPSVLKSSSLTNMTCGSDLDSNDFLSHSMQVSEARKRSYLVGSVGPTSLLGTQELDRQLPDRTLRIFVGTWNMNGQVPPRHLSEFLLPDNIKYVPDLLVIGTQVEACWKLETYKNDFYLFTFSGNVPRENGMGDSTPRYSWTITCPVSFCIVGNSTLVHFYQERLDLVLQYSRG